MRRIQATAMAVLLCIVSAAIVVTAAAPAQANTCPSGWTMVQDKPLRILYFGNPHPHLRIQIWASGSRKLVRVYNGSGTTVPVATDVDIFNIAWINFVGGRVNVPRHGDWCSAATDSPGIRGTAQHNNTEGSWLADVQYGH